MTSPCRVCTLPTDAFLCRRCVGQLRRALTEMPEDLRELAVTVSRQDRGTGAPLYAMRRDRVQQPGVHYDEGDSALPSTAWPFSWDAANVAWTVEQTVTAWARHLAESRGLLPLPEVAKAPAGPLCGLCLVCAHESCRTLLRARRVAARALERRRRIKEALAKPGRFLLEHLDSIRLDEAAAEIHDEIRACRSDIAEAIDRQTPEDFLGRCEAVVATFDYDPDGVLVPVLEACGADLYVRAGDDTVRCPQCRTEYDVVALERRVRASLTEAWATPKVIADALSTAEQPINAATLRVWIHRDAKLVDALKEGPACTDCGHRTCAGIRAARTAFLAGLQGRPLILRRGWDGDGNSVYRAGDVQARIAWAATRQAGRVSA